MKRSAVIAGVLVCAALGVGAFVFAGNDGGGKHKAAATIVKPEPKHDTTTTTKTTDPPKVASEAPVPTKRDDTDEIFVFHTDDKEELDGYEVRKAFVGVSPSVARPGRLIELEVRNFGPKEVVVVAIGVLPTITLTTDKHGRAKTKFVAPSVIGIYVVHAHGNTSGRDAIGALKVVLKK